MLGFNWLDFILIFMLLLGMAIGYAQGLIRQLLGLAAVYVGLVIAIQFFVPVTQGFASLTRNPPNTLTNAISFFTLLVLTMFVLNLLGQDAYKSLKFKIYPLLDHLTGMALGVMSMWIILTVAINVLTFAINTQSWGNADAYRFILENGFTESRISEVTASTLPMIVATVRPWLPFGMPAIFEL